MTKPISTHSIANGTGISWDDWMIYLEKIGASQLDHPQIAAKVQEYLKQAGKSADSDPNWGWWAQSVTVAYEQQIGRRVPGQRADGTFEVTVTRTLEGDMDTAFAWWLDRVVGITEINGLKLTGELRTSMTEKWRYWRVDLEHGVKLSVSTSNKSEDKSLLAVTVSKLNSPDKIEGWRDALATYIK